MATVSAPATNLSNLQLQQEDGDVGQLGGTIKRFLAGTSLVIGDVVYLSTTTDTVTKSTTASAYGTVVGVVVGGQSFSLDGAVNIESAVVGNTAAASGEWVLVQLDGITYVKAQAAVSTSGLKLLASATTAGQVAPISTTGAVVGISVEAIGAAAVGRMLIRPYYQA